MDPGLPSTLGVVALIVFGIGVYTVLMGVQLTFLAAMLAGPYKRLKLAAENAIA